MKDVVSTDDALSTGNILAVSEECFAGLLSCGRDSVKWECQAIGWSCVLGGWIKKMRTDTDEF